MAHARVTVIAPAPGIRLPALCGVESDNAPRIMERLQLPVGRPVVPEKRVAIARQSERPVDVEAPAGANPYVAEDGKGSPAAGLKRRISADRQMSAGAVDLSPQRHLVWLVGVRQEDVRVHVRKCGGRLAGQLHPKGSGAPAKPIMVDRYGDGANPMVAGEGKVENTIRLHRSRRSPVGSAAKTSSVRWRPG